MIRIRQILQLWSVALLFLAPLFAQAKALKGFEVTKPFGEQVLTITNPLGVRISINAPAPKRWDAGDNLTLIIYALPNGNTTEQTIGRRMKQGDDWHFDIQHIGAQTRFLRNVLTNETVIIAYLENSLKSWPAWRKNNDDADIPGLIELIKAKIGARPSRITLTGHSGGGSFTFGYLNAVEKIPGEIERIAFLDSNYAYDTGSHRGKLLQWLQEGTQRSLLVFAYEDHVALLNGKTFVSAAGGTWGRSQQMRKDFESSLKFNESALGELKVWTALNERMRFFLKENPEKKIYHTIQVERNGLIHAILAGTPHESRGYQYFGSRAYSELIQD